MKTIDANTFQSFVSENKDCIVMFGASWCGPCRAAKPKVENLSSNSSFPVVYADVDDMQNIAQSFGIMSVPTFVKFENGKPKNTLVGASDDGLRILFGM